MSTLELHIPDDTTSLLEVSNDGLGRELLLLAAIKLYEIGRISSGQAARLAGISRIDLLTRLKDYQVSAFQVTPEELRRDVLNA